MEPHGLDGVEPGALDRQVAVDDADASARLLDLLVVGADPGADLGADVPGGVVPDQQQRGLSRSLQLRAAPGQELGGDRTDRAAVDEAQPDLLPPLLAGRGPADQQPVAGQGLGIGIVLRDRLLDQVEGLLVLGPRVQAGRGQATPPDLILEPQRPLGVGQRQPDQAVARTFLRK